MLELATMTSEPEFACREITAPPCVRPASRRWGASRAAASLTLLALALAGCETAAPPVASVKWLQAQDDCRLEAAGKVPSNASQPAYEGYIAGCMKQHGFDYYHPS